jgi:hypothetical protein
VDNKNGQIAHRRIVAGWEILRNYGRNNNSPGTGWMTRQLHAAVLTSETPGADCKDRTFK